jgi:hypothetical protein
MNFAVEIYLMDLAIPARISIPQLSWKSTGFADGRMWPKRVSANCHVDDGSHHCGILHSAIITNGIRKQHVVSSIFAPELSRFDVKQQYFLYYTPFPDS